jgi:putative redox protein
MKHQIKANWIEKMQFDIQLGEYTISVDANKENGGNNKGPSPKPLMLAALAGCTGMDVVSILEKMRVEYDDLEIVVEGDVNDEHPKKYNKMHIIYKLKGKNLAIDKIEKAVQLSQDKYCGVAALYKEVIDVSYEIQLID